jgi:hypothetical protein
MSTKVYNNLKHCLSYIILGLITNKYSWKRDSLGFSEKN